MVCRCDGAMCWCDVLVRCDDGMAWWCVGMVWWDGVPVTFILDISDLREDAHGDPQGLVGLENARHLDICLSFLLRILDGRVHHVSGE